MSLKRQISSHLFEVFEYWLSKCCLTIKNPSEKQQIHVFLSLNLVDFVAMILRIIALKDLLKG